MYYFAASASTNPTFYADVVEPQTLNKYQYPLNNPLRFVDPDGHQEKAKKSLTEQAKDALDALWTATGGRALRIWRGEEESPRGDPAEQSYGPGGPLPPAGELVAAANKQAGGGFDVAAGTLIIAFDRTGVVNITGAVLRQHAGQGDKKDIVFAVGGVALTIASKIGGDKVLSKLAAEAGGAVQKSIDTLTAQLAKGNLNPGIGTKQLFGDILYARARDGARVFFRQTQQGIEIVGKAHKKNEQQVIDRLKKLYGTE